MPSIIFHSVAAGTAERIQNFTTVHSARNCFQRMVQEASELYADSFEMLSARKFTYVDADGSRCIVTLFLQGAEGRMSVTLTELDD